MANYKTGRLERAEALFLNASRMLPSHAGIAENLAMVRAARKAARK